MGRFEDHVDVDIIVRDTGAGMSAAKLDALFAELEQVQTESDKELQEKLAPDTPAITADEGQSRTLGLGLAIVARVVRNMNGQLRLKSEEGKGSRMLIQISFGLPPDKSSQALTEEAPTAGLGPPSDQPTTPPVEKGEVLLVNKSAQKPVTPVPPSMVRHNSSESITSFKSAMSMKSVNSAVSVASAKSDVDRMIEAIQEPAMKPKSRMPESGQRRPTSSRRSSTFSRPQSAGALTSDAPLSTEPGPGEAPVIDTKTPVRSVRIPGDTSAGSSTRSHPRTPSRVLFDMPDKRPAPPSADHLNVLVAEDDPVNSKIMKKRLEKIGHAVHLTINGEECSSQYGEQPPAFDVVLMDMQVCGQIQSSLSIH